MLRLTKKTEYALLALRYLSRQEAGPASTREIAAHYNIPEMLLAKVLQVLKRRGIVRATKGAGGGYNLSRGLEAVPLLDVLTAFNEQTSLVECLGHGEVCAQRDQCDIRGPLEVLNQAIMGPLRAMSVRDLFAAEAGAMAQPKGLSIFR